MFELRICSAKTAIEDSWATKIISLVDPFDRFSKLDFSHRVDHHRERFDDVEGVNFINPDATLPRQDHIERCLAFSRKFTDGDKVIIHCHMGLRRSPALAIGVLIQAGLSAEDAAKTVLKIRPQAMPNKLIIQHLENILGTTISPVVDELFSDRGLWWGNPKDNADVI